MWYLSSVWSMPFACSLMRNSALHKQCHAPGATVPLGAAQTCQELSGIPAGLPGPSLCPDREGQRKDERKLQCSSSPLQCAQKDTLCVYTAEVLTHFLYWQLPFPSFPSIFYSPYCFFFFFFLSHFFFFPSGHMGILALSWSTGHYGANKQTLHMGCCFVSAANVCSTVSRNLFGQE